jgi:hypothetical protein
MKVIDQMCEKLCMLLVFREKPATYTISHTFKRKNSTYVLLPLY